MRCFPLLYECSYPPQCPDPPVTVADGKAISSAVSLLKTAKYPLVIIGKGNLLLLYTVQVYICMSITYLGAAYSGAEAEIQLLITRNGLPFLPTPMGKGVITDDHPLCVAPARSRCDINNSTVGAGF